MPSPIAHAVSGYVLAKVLPQQQKLKWRKKRDEIFYPVFIATVADIDFIPQLITGENYHRGLTHSLIFTIGFSAIASSIASYFWKLSYKQLFWFTFIIYSSHLLLDLFTGGRGIKLLLPFTDSFFKAPVEIFPGIKYSQGLWHSSHIYAITFELLYSVLLLWGLWLWKKSLTARKK